MAFWSTRRLPGRRDAEAGSALAHASVRPLDPFLRLDPAVPDGVDERLVVAVVLIGIRLGEALAHSGYETASMLNVRAAADAVAERFVSELPVRSADLREVFADDLEERAESLRDGVRFLADNTVSDPAKIVEGAELSAYTRPTRVSRRVTTEM